MDITIHNNLISILDLSIQQQLEIYDLAAQGNSLFSDYRDSLRGKVLGTLFFQPSTRTQFSFQSAFIRLGGQYIGCSDINHTRSGPPYYESIEDLGTILSNYCDIIAFRTIDDVQTQQLAKGAQVPVISAGSGNIEHPTQTLTDLFTIKTLLGDLKEYNILIVGTPRQRTINSFIKGISLWGENHFHILCQTGIEVPEEVKANLGMSKITYYHSWQEIFDSGITKTIAIIYVDKIFYETHHHTNFVPPQNEFISHFNSEVIILHPLPRTTEMPKFIDTLNGASYFYQAKNGLYVRSALFLKYFLS